MTASKITQLPLLTTTALGDLLAIVDIDDPSGPLTTKTTLTTLFATPGAITVIAVTDESADTTCFPLFVTDATGDLGPKSNAGLTFDSSISRLSATAFDSQLLRILDAGNTDFGAFSHDGTDFNLAFTNTTDWNITSAINYKFDNSIFITEKASANIDVAALGQWWVRDDAPNVPMFTDDAGTDFVLNGISTIQGKTASYTLILTDAEQTIRFTGSTVSKVLTIPANVSVAFVNGTLIGIHNDGTVTMTVGITTDILTFADDNTTGIRTLAPGATAVIQKVSSTNWKIGGSVLVT